MLPRGNRWPLARRRCPIAASASWSANCWRSPFRQPLTPLRRRYQLALNHHLRVGFHQGLALRPPPRLPRRIAQSHPPPCHTPPLRNSPMGSGLRNLCRPPRRRSSRPAIEAPRGYPRLLASARRELIEPAQWPPQPHHPWGCWILAGRAARSRSNNSVISTTEQHAALPYQGSARPVGLAAVRIHDADLYGRAFSK